MNEYILELKTKFGYNDELTDFLTKLIPNLIIYYGEEYKDVILSTLSNCEIHIQNKDEDPTAFLNSYFNVNEEWDLSKFIIGGIYHNNIKIKDNKIDTKPIIYIRRDYVVAYKPFDFNNEEHLSNLIFEICIAIKGYKKPTIENKKIVESIGLLKNIYSYSKEDDIKFEKSYMKGIEIAINTVETKEILEMITGKKQEVHGIKSAGHSAMRLLEHKDIAKIIRFSQFHGDDSWIKYLGEEQSDLLIENFDVIINSLQFNYSDIETDEKLKKILEKNRQSQDKIDNFVDEYSPKKDVDEFIKKLSTPNEKTNNNFWTKIIKKIKSVFQK